jgi:hypothetical protein
MSPGDKLAYEPLNCTGPTAVFHNDNHPLARCIVSSYHIYVLLPIMFLLHAIEVQFFVVPVIFLGVIDMNIAFTYVDPGKAFAASLSPLLSGLFLCIVGYRKDFLAKKTFQENGQKDAWLASVTHNFGTPLMTISFAASAMLEMDTIEDTRPMLKRQQVAVDYLRSVYSTVMYRKDGRKPVGKRQRFRVRTLQQACEDVTSTYGSSLFPDVAICYSVDIALPEVGFYS